MTPEENDDRIMRSVIGQIKRWPGIPALVTYNTDGSWRISTTDYPSDDYFETLPALREEMKAKEPPEVSIMFD